MRNKNFLKVSLVILCLVFTFELQAFIAGNESEKAFCCDHSGHPCPPFGSTGKTKLNSFEDISNSSIRELIIQGGGYLYQSSAYIDHFIGWMELAELSDPDYEKMQKLLDSAILNMENARSTYFQLKNLAAVTPYNREVTDFLYIFNYDKFQKSNGLIPAVFSKVVEFLSIGDVAGIYNEFYIYAGQLLDLMYVLKKDMGTGIYSNLSIVWRINQIYTEFRLFGQYTAQIFFNLE